ncbi:teichoic acid transporter [Geotalea uraniireducens]|uniref:Teichoic acid transporter n=1 Tax=Geotalea uraniireducens TaxID=351604 RepID=A0ABM8EKY1_9BACT|nr:oligosaccharide flippase family protein [Geotalea uraniireducens]BDV43060.1 teichoic acid transporter [Geotalea uraniireducens]
MTRRRILENIFSNWANLAVTILIAFIVSPVVVHSLGKERYGVWVLIASVTGYFTVLDFGVNTAIVRYISSSTAQQDHRRAREIYSTSLAIFTLIALLLLVFSSIFGLFFQNIFKLFQLDRVYLYAVFLLAAMDLASGLLFSVFLGSLSGLQEFKFINGSSIAVNIVRSVVLVYLLRHGYGLLTLAVVQLATNIVRAGCQYVLLKVRHGYLHFSRQDVSRDTLHLIYSYSIYSFIIAIALKLLFYTDSLVIGSLIGVSEVTFYAIPSTLLEYLEKFVWAMIAVLVPVISANEATGEEHGNIDLYVVGTRYSLLVIMPIVISLYFYGDDFISIWMGPEIGLRSKWVLRLLLIGFGLATSQLIAHGILKGISKHKVLAYILAVEALANLGMSIALAKPYGIEGVAVGTMVPLIFASLAIIFYTCRLLGMRIFTYLLQSYSGAIAGSLAALILVSCIQEKSYSYVGVFLKSALVTIAFMSVALPAGLKKQHWELFSGYIRRLFCFQND